MMYDSPQPPSFIKLREALHKYPGATCQELAHFLHLHADTVRNVMPQLKKLGLVHCPEWAFTNGHWAAMYWPGPGYNVPKPHLSAQEKLEKHREAVAKSKLLGRGPRPKKPKVEKKLTKKEPVINSGPFAGLGA